MPHTSIQHTHVSHRLRGDLIAPPHLEGSRAPGVDGLHYGVFFLCTGACIACMSERKKGRHDHLGHMGCTMVTPRLFLERVLPTRLNTKKKRKRKKGRHDHFRLWMTRWWTTIPPTPLMIHTFPNSPFADAIAIGVSWQLHILA